MQDHHRMKELALRLAARADELRAATPHGITARIQNRTKKVSAGLDPISRDALFGAIRDLSRLYSLQWLVRQELHAAGCILECLSDEDLVGLQEKLHRARECILEGISFDDAGLIRDVRYGD